MSIPLSPTRSSALLIFALMVALLVSCGSDIVAPPTTTEPSPPGTTATPVTTTESTTSIASPIENVSPRDAVEVGPGNTGALFGYSTGLSRAEREPRWRMIEEAAGRDYDIGHVFHSWDKAIPTQDDLMHINDGRLLMISWNGTDTKEIQAGIHDDWIRSQAEGTRDLGEQVLFRWLWEMDGNRRQAWVHSPEDYVAAWNHVREIFIETGATNAEFVWCPNEFLFWDGGDPEPWYPGDGNVDWLCADGYNWAPSRDDAAWVDLVDIFGDFYAWAEPKGKPIVIGESGIAETDPGAKAQWIRDIPVQLETNLPEIDAFVYFDKDFRDFGFVDWRVDTSDESFDAWIEISNHPYLKR